MRPGLFVALLLAVGGCAPDDSDPVLPATLSTRDTAERLAAEGMERWPSDVLALGWIETVWHYGLYRLHRRTGDPAWQDGYRTWLDDALPEFSGPDPRTFVSSDSMSPSTLASILLREDPAAATEPIVAEGWRYLDQVANRTDEGAITHWSEDTLIADNDEVWVDSQFMFGMFLLSEYDRSGDPAALDAFATQYRLFSDLCRDPADQLYRHAYKDATDANIPEEPAYWARGNSWVLISAAELLTRVPADHAAALEIGPLFADHAAAVIALQADDGLWRTVLNSPYGDDPANYTETSAAALIAYALILGTDSVLDPAVVDPVVARAVDGVVGRITEADGALHLSGTSFGTNPGDYAYYVSVPQLDDQTLGVGAAVMLLTEADGRPDP